MVSMECCICTENITDACEASATICGHLYHSKCINNWVKCAKNCPHCRGPCSTDKIFRIYFSTNCDENSDGDSDDENLQNQLKEAEKKVRELSFQVDTILKTKNETICQLNKKVLELNEKEEKLQENHSTEITQIQNDFAKIVKSLEEQIVNLQEENLMSKVCLESLKIK